MKASTLHYLKVSRFTFSVTFALFIALSIWNWKQPVQTGGYSTFHNTGAEQTHWLQSLTELKVLAPDGTLKDGFGYSAVLSADGKTALVGTYYTEFGITYPLGPGNVYVFILNGEQWDFQQKLPVPSSDVEADEFGSSVAISADGNTALIGAKGGDVNGKENQGTAYVFVRNGITWSEQTQLKASDGAAGDRFGISTALSSDGNTAMVGAYVDDIGSKVDQGSVYVFIRNGETWQQQTRLTATDGLDGDYFGRSVSLSNDGNYGLIGANMDDIGANGSQGSAYIFTRNSGLWSQQAKLVVADGGGYNWTGTSVSISGNGNTALIGAEGYSVDGNSTQGAAFIFTRIGTTWNQQARLTARDGEAGDMFGGAVALSADGDTALIGVHWDMVNDLMPGSAYIFTRDGNTWNDAPPLLASDGANGDNFGISVSLSDNGSVALIGADLDDIGSNANQGSAYFYTKPVTTTTYPLFLPLLFR